MSFIIKLVVAFMVSYVLFNRKKRTDPDHWKNRNWLIFKAVLTTVVVSTLVTIFSLMGAVGDFIEFLTLL